MIPESAPERRPEIERERGAALGALGVTLRRMEAPASPVFEDDGDLKPGERWASDSCLGRGHPATAQLKLAFLRLHWMFETGQLVLKPTDKQKVPRGNVAKVAMALGISPPAVQGAVNERERAGKVSDPDPRGPPPTDWDDYAPTEGFALATHSRRAGGGGVAGTLDARPRRKERRQDPERDDAGRVQKGHRQQAEEVRHPPAAAAQ